MTLASISRGALVGAAVLFLAGCKNTNPVGEGSGPVSISIDYNGTDELQTVECSTTQLAATAQFAGDHDSNGDVTSRVVWTSSNPGVIDVSNGDIEMSTGSGTYFPAGMVIARTTGTAIIRAAYADSLFATFSVEAGAIKSMRLSPVLTKVAPDSTTTMALYVQPQDDQLEQNLTASAIWSVPTASSAASLSGTSTVQAYATPLNSDFVVEAHLYTCDRTISQTMQIGSVKSLQLSYEQPTASPVPLVIADRLRVDAVFDDSSAPVQNLSNQVDIATVTGYASDIATTSSESTTATRNSDGTAQLGVDDYITISGLQKNKPVQFKLTYDQSGINLATTTREYTFSDTDVTSMRIAQSTFDLSYPTLGYLSAYATFEDGVERPMTRFVSWSTTTGDLLSIESGGGDGGIIVPQDLSGRARVYASYASGTVGELEENITGSITKQTN